jgi:hypothetical protein
MICPGARSGLFKGLIGVLFLGAAAVRAARAQDGPSEGETGWREPIFGRSLAPLLITDPPPASLSSGNRVARIPLLHMPAGFPCEPLGLEANDDPAGAGTSETGPPLPEPSPMQVWMGLDNPFFDYRWRNDPGGVGYYKLCSQMQLFDEGKTYVCLALQAVTPAGLEAGGVADGPTVFVPAVAWFQELGFGSALQGFVAKSIHARSGWTGDLENRIHYGMALQCAVPGLCTDSRNGLHLYLEALGRFRYDGENAPGRPMTLELIPGIHWQLADRWRLSFGAARTHVLTCQWHF